MKLTQEQLKDIERKAIRTYTPNVAPTKWWSLDDLAKGKMFSQKFINKVLKNVAGRRQEHRYSGWNGWTKKKDMRHETSIPVELYLQPEFMKKYFPEKADEHEKVKALEQLKRDYPQFKAY